MGVGNSEDALRGGDGGDEGNGGGGGCGVTCAV